MDKVSSICTECRACEQKCSHKAITMRMNDEGFCYPFIDKSICIDCGLCQRICPVLNAESLKNPVGDVYATQIKDGKVIRKSTSGGVFTLISSYILAKGGVVVGAAYQEHLQVKHVIVDNYEDLNLLRGAKYVHSDLGDVYKQIEVLLRGKRWVYFTGTPCQVAGLKSFLRKEYPTLVTSDLFCHGTPSQKIFDAFVNQIEQDNNSTLLEVKFRDKAIAGWGAFPSCTIGDGKKKNHKIFYERNLRTYYQTFVRGLITREDCFSCPFACPERTGDITIADYWDIEYFHPNTFDVYHGVSLITVNTPLGRELWNHLKNNTKYVSSKVDFVLKTNNNQFKHPTPRPEGRNESVCLALKSIPEFVAKELPKNDKLIFIKSIIKNKIWRYSMGQKIIRYMWKRT